MAAATSRSRRGAVQRGVRCLSASHALILALLFFRTRGDCNGQESVLGHHLSLDFQSRGVGGLGLAGALFEMVLRAARAKSPVISTLPTPSGALHASWPISARRGNSGLARPLWTACAKSTSWHVVTIPCQLTGMQ